MMKHAPNRTRDHVDDVTEHWGREHPELDLELMGVMGRLWRAARISLESCRAMLASHDLEPGWFDVLGSLRRMGEPYELTPGELMRATLLSSGGMTKRLDRMEDAGLVHRVPAPDDRRSVLVKLTEKGRHIADDMLEHYMACQEQLMSTFGREERLQLDDLLRTMLTQWEPSQA
jgi:DNA-binding MarR family transcriptional regulator